MALLTRPRAAGVGVPAPLDSPWDEGLVGIPGQPAPGPSLGKTLDPAQWGWPPHSLQAFFEDQDVGGDLGTSFHSPGLLG